MLAGLLTWVLVAAVARAEVYKWVDKDGVTHYSDRPVPGAEEVTLPPAQTYQAPPARAAAPPAAASTAPPGTPIVCKIRSPGSEEVLLNVPSIIINFQGPEGTLPVLMLNNQRYAAEPGSTSIKIEPAPRGTYEARLTFQDGERKAVCTAPMVRFYVRQPSVLRPGTRR